MIYRLIYCNKNGDSARIDIIKGALTPVETIEGTDNPFLLSYKMDTSNKSGFFMNSSANISVYESGTFNIDNLKTSSETELKVEYYINDVLFWSGFIIPDFFSRNIGVPATIEMVASDRIGTLKGSTLLSLTQYVSMRDIAVACLAKTGLSLPLLTMADFGNNGQTNAFFKSLGLSGRLSDTKGRNISCYDILRSILVACDGKLLQQDGAWYIVNKFQHEQGSGNLFSSLTASTPYVEQSVPFSEVDTGARRTIIPVAATTGVYHEHGGNRPRPVNYDFTQMLSGWSTVGGFNAVIGDKLIKEFTAGGSGGAIISIVPDNNVTIKPYLINNNEYIRNINPKYIESANIDIPYTGYGVININVDVNATGPAIAHPSRPSAFMRIAVVAIKGTTVKTLDHGGAFINMPSENPPVFAKEFERGTDFTNIRAVTSGMIVNGKLEIPEGDSFSNWKIRVRVYGSGGGYDVAFNSTIVKLSLGATDSPKGNIYKRNQGANFTSEYPIDTTIFGDYITNGLNGYFYNYSIDDTSSLFSEPDVLIQPKWTAHADADELPLLQHVARQRSRMFSIAHDLINASIDVEAFKPLSIFVDCNSKRYCVVSANFDFLRSKVEVEIEQISYASLEVREFIYSYFGDSDTGISSIGGITGGSTGTGTGGGMTAEQIEILNNLSSWWKLDADGYLYSDLSVYSTKGVSAYGPGTGGGGGGGSLSGLSDVMLTSLAANNLLQFNGTHWVNVPASSVGTPVSWGTTSNNTSPLTVSGTTKTVSLSGHLHAGVYEPVFTKNTAFNKNFGTTAGTVAEGNDSRINNGQTAFGWGNHASAGYALNSSLNNYLPLAGGTLTNNIGNILNLDTSGTDGSYIISKLNNVIKAYYGWHPAHGVFIQSGTAPNAAIGITDAQVPYFKTTSSGTVYNLWHAGNFTPANYLPLTGGTMANTNLVANLNADLLDGYHASEIAETGLLYTYRAAAVGGVNFWHKLGTLTLPAVTGSGKSKVVAQITGLANFGTNEHRILILKASTRGSVEVNGLMIKGNSTDVRVGYVDNGSTIEIWVGYVGFYNTDTNIEIINSTNFTIDRVVQASMPANFATCPILVSATTASNVASATKLQTPRTIAGVSFDGTANIAIPFANLSSKPTTLAGYGITDFTSHNNSTPINSANTTVNAIGYTNSVSLFGQNDGGLINIAYSTALQSQIFQDFRTGQIALRGKNNGTWTDWRTVWDSVNLSPVTLDTAQTITAQKTFSDGDAVYGLTAKPSIILGGDNTTNAGAIKLWGNTAGAYGLLQATGVDMELSHNSGGVYIQHYGSGRVVLASGGGNVGIGEPSPSHKLHVAGNIYSTANLIANTGITIAQVDGTGIGLSLYGTAGTDTSTNPTYGIMFALTANKGTHGAVTGDFATYFTMDVSASRGWIFTNNAGGSTGNVASISNTGTIVASGGITAYTASDKRFKTDIRDITTGLNTVMKLNPVMYSYNSLAKSLNATLPDFDYGLIAQDVKDVMPDIVHSMFNDEYLGIDYIKLIPILISAIKEQQSQISELKKMLNA